MKIISKHRSEALPNFMFYHIRLDGEEKLIDTVGTPLPHLEQIKEKLPLVLLLDAGSKHLIPRVGFKIRPGNFEQAVIYVKEGMREVGCDNKKMYAKCRLS